MPAAAGAVGLACPRLEQIGALELAGVAQWRQMNEEAHRGSAAGAWRKRRARGVSGGRGTSIVSLGTAIGDALSFSTTVCAGGAGAFMPGTLPLATASI